MEVISTHLLKNVANQKKNEKRLDSLEELCKKFVYKTEFDTEKDRIQKEIYDFTKEKLDDFQQKLVEHANDMEEKKTYCENLVKQNEANTLWKIKDCEGKTYFLPLCRSTSKQSK